MTAAVSCPPFAQLALWEYVWFVERVPTRTAAGLYRWRALRDLGWDVTALLAPDEKTMVGLGVRYADWGPAA